MFFNWGKSEEMLSDIRAVFESWYSPSTHSSMRFRKIPVTSLASD